jgi:membrane protease YdiL (CAAX protease family)
MSTASAKPVQTPQVQATWNPATGVVFVLAVFFISQIIASLLVAIYPLMHHWTAVHAENWLSNSVGAQFVYVALAEIFSIAAVYWFVRRWKQGLDSIGLLWPLWRDAGIGLLALPFYFVLYLLTVGVVSHFAPSLNIDQAQQIGFDHVAGGLQLTLTFISLVLLPPLAEEIMVRGLLFTSLKKAMRLWPAALLTSLIFAAAHLPEGGAAGPLWIGFIDTFILSLVLCYLRQRTGSLWAGITLHALKNGIAFVALFIIGTR